MKHSLVLPVLAASAALLPAQAWTESGDAGAVPGSAQIVAGSGPLNLINGTLAGDVDLYLIQIDAPAAFLATLAGTPWDTQLFLFDEQGRGVTANDDYALLQSRLTGANLRAPGRYYLAISAFDCDPITAVGDMWLDSGASNDLPPDGPGRREVLAGWSWAPSTSGNYSIQLTGASMVGRQLVLPDNHHRSESPTQGGASGSLDFWDNSQSRFQLVYEASHFLAAGVTSPIAISRVMFRGEDGEPNAGGVVWSNVQVRVGATSQTAATLSTTFAANLSPVYTTLGTTATTNVTMQPSRGSVPNNYNIVLDLAALGASIVLDPNGPQPNLLIDITCPSAPLMPSGTVMAMQNTTGNAAAVRGAGVFTPTPASVTGTATTAPLVVGVEFAGSGGSRLVVPASNEYYGGACGGSASAFYQAFLQGEAFDLAGLKLTPDNLATPTRYTVTTDAAPIDLTKVNPLADSAADDATVSKQLGFTFRYPGGSTTSIAASTNGFVWLDGTLSESDLSPTVGELLGSAAATAARLAPCWTDLHAGRNAGGLTPAGLHVKVDTSGGPGNAVCYVTWLEVGVFNSVPAAGASSNDMQCVIHEATGVVEFRYGRMMPFCARSDLSTQVAAIVGWSRGRIGGVASADPQTRDLSLETPFTTRLEGGQPNMALRCVTTPVAGGSIYGGRLFAGQTATWNVSNVPAGALLGVQLLDILPTRPGFAAPTLTAPGCVLSTSSNALLWEVDVLPGGSVTGTVPFAIPAGYDGFRLYTQYVVLDGLFGAADLITSSSNALEQIVGRN